MRRACSRATPTRRSAWSPPCSRRCCLVCAPIAGTTAMACRTSRCCCVRRSTSSSRTCSTARSYSPRCSVPASAFRSTSSCSSSCAWASLVALPTATDSVRLRSRPTTMAAMTPTTTISSLIFVLSAVLLPSTSTSSSSTAPRCATSPSTCRCRAAFSSGPRSWPSSTTNSTRASDSSH